MKVIEHIEKATETLFTYEIVPPPRGRSLKDVLEIVEKLAVYNPKWIDVTSHSSGAYYKERPDGTVDRIIQKKRPGTIGICGLIQNQFNIDTVPHLLCQGFTREETEDALIELNYLGIENILALRGDGVNYDKKHPSGKSTNQYATDLVEQVSNIRKAKYLEEIKKPQSIDFCVGVAGYPEKHFEAPNLASDIEKLKIKVDAGAHYITTQMFFNNQAFFDFVKTCREAGITVPIIPGLKVLKRAKHLETLPKFFFLDFPDELAAQVKKDPEHAEEIGYEWTCKQVEELLDFGVPSIHFYVMNDTETVTKVVEKFQHL